LSLDLEKVKLFHFFKTTSTGEREKLEKEETGTNGGGEGGRGWQVAIGRREELK
jgi:hypothetical protein